MKVINKSYISKKTAVAIASAAALITGLVMMPQTNAQTACVSKSVNSLQNSYSETQLRDLFKTSCINVTYGGVLIATSTPATSTPTPTPTPPVNAAPTVNITAPAANATVSGSTTVAATASDDKAVANVQFKLDGNNLSAADTTSPYSVAWDTTTATNGSHTLTAVATDSEGLTKTSTAVTVNVQNTTTNPPVGSTQPSAVVGTKWTVMAPFYKVGSTSSPENLPILQAEKDSRYATVMYPENGGITFKANAGGAHSANSKYARAELREMKDDAWTNGSWTNTSGTHTLEGEVSVTHNFVKRPQLVFAQIHDGSDDVLQLAVDGSKVVLFYNDKTSVVDLGTYTPNQKMTYKLVAAGSKVEVYFNGVKKHDVPKSGSGWYFKTGSYLQTNVADWAEASTATGAVTIYSVKVTHL